MPSLNLRNALKRNPNRPTLKARAASLKAGLSRLIQRPAQHGEADQGRRAVMAGTVAAAIPLPALALGYPASPAVVAVSDASHPDRALLDVEAALERALEVEKKAKQARGAAGRIVGGVLRSRPIALVPASWEWAAFTSYRLRAHWGQAFRFRPIPADDLPEDHQRWQHAWTGKALRLAISRAVPVLGHGGRTPHHVKRWRELLPIADAFDAEVEAVEVVTDVARLTDEARAASAMVSGLRSKIGGMTATTPDGLAVHVRALATSDWHKRNDSWHALLVSAAAVTGTELRQPDFDVPAWVSAWECCGGRIDRLKRRHHQDEWAFVYPSLKDAGPMLREEARRLEEHRRDNSAVIGRWLDANR
ncbi:hypothetical protein FHR71_003674 [Methylobacterium sp. RAS18]|nr:hypothetical protein [Methylobacterium sp. RAS18]